MKYVCGECGERFDRPGYCARDGKPIDATEDPMVGSEVGRYRVARLLAEGGMGRVYLGVQPTIGSRVAIKILADSTSPDLLDRFFAEARAVNMIRHENIVSVIDMAKLDDGRPYIVMEYIEGATLASLVKGGGAPLGGVVQVMLEVLSALAAAHHIGIVHRDLKPDNVLVTGEGHAKVLDFGIAKLLPGLSQHSPRTRTGALLGTPAYMAPEQISGSGQIDPRTDIYAAGIVFFEAVTGRVPFVGETLFDLMRMHLEVAPPSPRALRPDLPPPLEGVIATALSKQPAQRFQTALAMAQALQHASNELRPEDWRALSTRGAIITGGRASTHISQPHKTTSATPTPRRDQRATQSTRKNLPWILGIAATAAIAVLVTVFVMRRTDEPVNVVTPTPMPPILIDANETLVVAPADAPPAPNVAEQPKPGQAPAKQPAPAPMPAKTSKNEIVVPADYNAKKVDPMAYLPKAIALAQQLYPDAKLTRFDFTPVRASGVADLTMKDAEGSYWFRSPLHSKRPTDVPRNVPVDRPCMIYVELEPTQVTARIVTNDECNDNLVRVPKCKVADVWKQALAIGVPGDHVAKVSWLFDEKWFFDSDLSNSGSGETTSFEDRCP
jgi:serine/threonine protein kinase